MSQGQVALVDDQDYDWLSQWKWHARQGRHTFYAQRNRIRPHTDARGPILMHHEILGKPETGFQTDHIDGDGLNNQKNNLRNITNIQNSMNQRSTVGASEFKGVTWHLASNKWMARIGVNYQRKHLGLFVSEEEAARAYDAAALEYFGEFASPNFLPEV